MKLNCIIYIVMIIIVIIFIGGKIFLRAYKNKDLGKKFFQESEKPFPKSALSMYYDKQMIYRKFIYFSFVFIMF